MKIFKYRFVIYLVGIVAIWILLCQKLEDRKEILTYLDHCPLGYSDWSKFYDDLDTLISFDRALKPSKLVALIESIEETPKGFDVSLTPYDYNGVKGNGAIYLLRCGNDTIVLGSNPFIYTCEDELEVVIKSPDHHFSEIAPLSDVY